jgi:hypothetical protein
LLNFETRLIAGFLLPKGKQMNTTYFNSDEPLLSFAVDANNTRARVDWNVGVEVFHCVEARQHEYNEARPKKSLGGLTPSNAQNNYVKEQLR